MLGGNIKRKVVQHGPSTLIISLPSGWAKRQNIKRGDQLDVAEESEKLVISAVESVHSEKVHLDISDFGEMVPRTIHALYKRGVDEVELSYKDPSVYTAVQLSLGKEAIGFEILEAGKNRCVVKNVSEGGREFGQILRQTFLMLMAMGEEGHQALKQGNISDLRGLIPLEQGNNRFTTLCRRYVNMRGSQDFDRPGPLYYILEQLEKIADTYKYMFSYFCGLKGEVVIHKELLECFEESNKIFRDFYEVFYTFDAKQLERIKISRDHVVERLYTHASKIKTAHEVLFFHHLMQVITDTFSLADAYMVLAAKNFVTSAEGTA